MARHASPTNPPCPRCGTAQTVRDGHAFGTQRWRCRACRRSFGPTTGTAVYRLKTPPAEVARALLVVLRRGSLAAAEEVTGHKYESVGRWLTAAGRHADALTDVLVHDLHLCEVEVDEFWSFVRTKGAPPAPRLPPAPPPAGRAGAA